MDLEIWFVLAVAGAFLLVGIAGSPLAWVALQHRKSKLENLMEKRWTELTAELRGSRAGWRSPKRRTSPPRGSTSPVRVKTGRTGERIPIDRS